jgi:hypothetical protein
LRVPPVGGAALFPQQRELQQNPLLLCYLLISLSLGGNKMEAGNFIDLPACPVFVPKIDHRPKITGRRRLHLAPAQIQTLACVYFSFALVWKEEGYVVYE